MTVNLLKNNISEFIDEHSLHSPNKDFIILNEKEKYSFSEINGLINAVCIYFKKLNLKKGDIISLIFKNSLEYILFYFAGIRFGVIVNPYPFTLNPVDLSKYLMYIKPKAIFSTINHYNGLKEIGINSIEIKKSFIENLKPIKNYKSVTANINDPACIYYSSGTTGNPKGIVVSHKNMLSNIISLIKGFKHSKEDIHLILLPLGHTASINYSLLPSVINGNTILLKESFWKIRNNFWGLIKEFKVSYIEVVPSVLIAILNTPYPASQYKNINEMRFIGCGSSKLPINIQKKFMKKFGIKVANLYGLSETGPTHIDHPNSPNWAPGSIGYPLDVNRVEIADDNGKLLGGEEIGEIIIKGDNVFTDYYKNKNLYDITVKNGFFYTGDIGYKDKDGKFYYEGRKKELIIKGGVNISPDEIDEFIFTINGVKESLTIPGYDDILGEKIITFVVLQDNVDLTEKNILNECSANLSRDKIPDQIIFIDSLPKGPSGKYLRKELIKKMRLQ